MLARARLDRERVSKGWFKGYVYEDLQHISFEVCEVLYTAEMLKSYDEDDDYYSDFYGGSEYPWWPKVFVSGFVPSPYNEDHWGAPGTIELEGSRCWELDPEYSYAFSRKCTASRAIEEHTEASKGLLWAK